MLDLELFYIEKLDIILDMVFFLLIVSLVINVASYYVNNRISSGLTKQSTAYDQYQKQKNLVQGNLSTLILSTEYSTKYNEDQIF